MDSSMVDRPPEQPRLSRAELAQEAESLLGHPIFKEAVLELRHSLLQRLLALPAGDPKVTEIHTKAKLLDEIVGELRSYVTEIKLRRQKSSEAA